MKVAVDMPESPKIENWEFVVSPDFSSPLMKISTPDKGFSVFASIMKPVILFWEKPVALNNKNNIVMGRLKDNLHSFFFFMKSLEISFGEKFYCEKQTNFSGLKISD